MLADEPTANLDHKTGSGILQLMKESNRYYKTTFIFSTHDRRVMDMADRLIMVEDGEIRMFGIKGANKWLMVNERMGTMEDAPIVEDNLI